MEAKLQIMLEIAGIYLPGDSSELSSSPVIFRRIVIGQNVPRAQTVFARSRYQTVVVR